MEVNRTRYSQTRSRPPKKSRRLLWICFVVIVVAVGYGLSVFMSHKSKSPTDTVAVQSPLLKDAQLDWPVTGQAAIGTVADGLLARSSDNQKPRPIASMAKVITALAIMEKQPFELGQDGQSYTINKEDIQSLSQYVAEDGSVLPLLIGMEITQYQAMQRMLIASDNNMADILAERIFGSTEAYNVYAQDMLQRMGLSQTVVADASGFNSDTVSTPSEMVMIGIAALKNPVIAEIVGQQQAELPVVGTIQNTNQLLGIGGVIGLKTGTTDEAGSCLLFAARYTSEDAQEVTVVGVVMGSKTPDTRFSDSQILLDSVKRNLGLSQTVTTNNAITSPLRQRGSSAQ